MSKTELKKNLLWADQIVRKSPMYKAGLGLLAMYWLPDSVDRLARTAGGWNKEEALTVWNTFKADYDKRRQPAISVWA